MTTRILLTAYKTFAWMLVLAVAFAWTADRYEERQNRNAVQHWDAERGTWKEGYDWRARNRMSERLRSIRIGLFLAAWVSSIVCAVFSAVKAIASPIYWLACLFFAALAFFFGLILLLGRAIGGGGIIG